MARYVLSETSARKLRALLNSGAVAGSIPGNASELTIDERLPRFFEIQYRASYNDGEGAWIIYLGREDGADIVPGHAGKDLRAYMRDEDIIDYTAVDSGYPDSEGWYELLIDIPDDEYPTIYFRVWNENVGGQEVTRSDFDTEPKTGAIINMPIAQVNHVPVSGWVDIDQIFTGPLVLSKGGANYESGSYSNLTFTPNAQTGKIGIDVFYV